MSGGTYGYSPIEDNDGVQGALVVCNDVTPQHQAKAELEQMTKALVEQIRQRELAQQHEAIQTAQRVRAERELHKQRGPSHVFEFANAAYLRLVGQRDLVGKTVCEALPEIAGQGFFELLDAVYLSGEPYKAFDLPLNLQRCPGCPVTQAYLDFVYQPIVVDGAVTGIFVQGFDATERTLARQALQRSELRLKEGMKAARMAVWDWGLATAHVGQNSRADRGAVPGPPTQRAGRRGETGVSRTYPAPAAAAAMTSRASRAACLAA